MSEKDGRLLWRQTSRRRVATFPIFSLDVSERTSARGAAGSFCILTPPDWVNVVPLVRGPGGEELFVMVRQYRHGAEMITTEFPAGLTEPEEDDLHAAERELAEETGFRARAMIPLGRVRPNPALQTNWCSTFLAVDCERVSGGSPDALEEIETVLLPVRQVEEEMGSGEMVNSLAIVALHLYLRWKEGRGGRGADRNRTDA